MRTHVALTTAVFAAVLAQVAACGDEDPANIASTSTSGGGSTSTGGAAASSTSSGGGSGGGGGGPEEPYVWGLPKGIPEPRVPASNPMSAVKVELGRRLFYDKRLSANQTYSCASCHDQKLAFTDGKAHAVGSTGEVHPRSAMALVNVAYASVLTWANPLIQSLEQQALLPMFGETPVELGLSGKEAELFARLDAEPIYRDLFPRAFPGVAEPISLATVTAALAAFERSLISFNSPYDRYTRGETSSLSKSALRGRDLFFSETLQCFHCHGSFDFSDSVVHVNSTFVEVEFHNTGLYNLGGVGDYPPDNTGVFAITSVPTDMGRFRAPTLRNIGVTAPYMHDGSVETLTNALDHYAAGGRTINLGPYAGDGSKNPFKDALIAGFHLTAEDKGDVIAFLKSLTDQEFLHDPRFADPWPTPP
jgi:cytochrome c peroxidase